MSGTMSDPRRGETAVVTVVRVALLALIATAPDSAAQERNVRDVPIPHDVGQSISPSFEGWFENARDAHPARFLSWR